MLDRRTFLVAAVQHAPQNKLPLPTFGPAQNARNDLRTAKRRGILGICQDSVRCTVDPEKPVKPTQVYTTTRHYGYLGQAVPIVSFKIIENPHAHAKAEPSGQVAPYNLVVN
jgi:hypothetical protein